MNDQTTVAPRARPAAAGSAIQLTKTDVLFASPLFSYRLPHHEALNSQLLADISRLRDGAAGIKRSNRHGWHSDPDIFKRPEASFQRLGQEVVTIVSSASVDVSPRLDTSRYQVKVHGWVNVNQKGAFNLPHDHQGEMWSGCYYVKLPQNRTDRSGDIEFLDPRGNVQVTGVPESPHFVSRFRKSPEEGLLLLFPSYLKHWVYPNEEDEERVTIAFNARLVRRREQQESPEPESL